MIIWPFKPLTDVVEVLEWATDVIQTKGLEQRFAMRTLPRRTFNYRHVLNSHELAHARALIRETQGKFEFVVPDWPQAVPVGALADSVAQEVPISFPMNIGAWAVVWESAERHERVSVTETVDGYLLAPLVQSYTDAYFIPALDGLCLDGLTADRGPGANTFPMVELNIAFLCCETPDLTVVPTVEYQGKDVLDECPVVAGGSFSEGINWLTTQFDNNQNTPHLIRARNVPENTYQMRWHVFTREDLFALLQWFHFRRGRQRSFYMSSRARDIEPAADISGSTALVYSYPAGLNLGRSEPFDIEIVTTTGKQYVRVNSINSVSSTVSLSPDAASGPQLIELELDQVIVATDIERISFFRLTRFDSDALELTHAAQGGVSVSAALIEVLN